MKMSVRPAAPGTEVPAHVSRKSSGLSVGTKVSPKDFFSVMRSGRGLCAPLRGNRAENGGEVYFSFSGVIGCGLSASDR